MRDAEQGVYCISTYCMTFPLFFSFRAKLCCARVAAAEQGTQGKRDVWKDEVQVCSGRRAAEPEDDPEGQLPPFAAV